MSKPVALRAYKYILIVLLVVEIEFCLIGIISKGPRISIYTAAFICRFIYGYIAARSILAYRNSNVSLWGIFNLIWILQVI